jgi:hypothetical protein
MRGVAITPVIFSFLLAGCAIKRDHYDVPVAPLPSQFQKSVLFPKAKQAPEAKESTVSANPVSEADLDEWWRSLGSAELNALVDQALANNMDLRIAMLRLVQYLPHLWKRVMILRPTVSTRPRSVRPLKSTIANIIKPACAAIGVSICGASSVPWLSPRKCVYGKPPFRAMIRAVHLLLV